MNVPTRLLFALGPVLLVAACAEAPVEQAPEARIAAEPLPITTSSPEALADFEAGLAKVEVGRALEARRLFESALAKDPQFTVAYLGLAEASYSPQEFKENLDLAFESLEGKTEAEQIMVALGRTYLTNDVSERLELARRLTTAHPNSPRAWQALGWTRYSRGEHEESREAFSRAIELDPEYLGGYFGLWNSYLHAEPKDFERSKQAMESALEIAEGEAQLYQNLGDTLRAMNDLETARAYYGQAIERDPGGPVGAVASLKKGHINSFLGNYEEARADYDQGLEQASSHHKPEYANYRTFIHLHAADPAAAIAEQRKLLEWIDELDLDESQRLKGRMFTLGNAAQIALHVGDLDQARELLEWRANDVRAYAAAVGDADFQRREEAGILLWEGQLHARSGDYEAALAAAQEIREILADDGNPRSLEGYHGLLGLVDLLRGDYEQAASHFEQSDLMKAYVKYHLALALEGAGESERAKTLFGEVAEWNFNSVGFALVRKDAQGRAS